jgi:hypothetical protein
MEVLSENQNMKHKELHLLAKKEVEDFKKANEIKKAQAALAQQS